MSIRPTASSSADIHMIRRRDRRRVKNPWQKALDRFASLPRHVRVLWLIAAFEALALATRAA